MSSRRAALESLAIVGTLAAIATGLWGYTTLSPSVVTIFGIVPKTYVFFIPSLAVFASIVFAVAKGDAEPRMPWIRVAINTENSQAIFELMRELRAAGFALLAVVFALNEVSLVETPNGLWIIIPSIVLLYVAPIVLCRGYGMEIAKAANPRPEHPKAFKRL